MDDAEFIDQFERCTLPGESFHHRDHVKMVWLYLERYSVIAALERFSAALKRFAAANGKPNLYHETITWAYVLLIHERRQRNGADQRWDSFAEANPDLLAWPNTILKSYYTEETLKSDFAKRVFVLPDKRNRQDQA